MSVGFTYFFTLIAQVYAMLKGFKIGIGNVSWIDFVIYLAFAAIVIKALVNRVSPGGVTSSFVRRSRGNQKESSESE